MKHIKGFTLIEIAIVLAIIGLLVGTGFSSLGGYLDNAKQSHTQGNLLATKQALLNYVKVNKHMPCPDADGNGVSEPRIGTNSTRCSTSLGTVPYDDIGLPRAVASDDYANLFGYAIHEEASNAGVMDVSLGDSSLLLQPGAYFYNTNAPVFDIDTPPTEINGDDLAESYQVCTRTASDDCSGANDVEMQFLPVVLIAYNENGSNTTLTSCSGSWGTRENENCDTSSDTNPMFIRGTFNEGVFDDQVETISAYEIKKYALGDLDDFELQTAPSSTSSSSWENYSVIINKDLESSNELNVANVEGGGQNAYLITGDIVQGNILLKKDADVLSIQGEITDGAGNIDGGEGDSAYDFDLISLTNARYSTLSDLVTVSGLVSDFEYICNDSICIDEDGNEITGIDDVDENGLYVNKELMVQLLKINSSVITLDENASCLIQLAIPGGTKKKTLYPWNFILRNAGITINLSVEEIDGEGGEVVTGEDVEGNLANRISNEKVSSNGSVLSFDLLNLDSANKWMRITINAPDSEATGGCSEFTYEYETTN